jgi:hypothetical protein
MRRREPRVGGALVPAGHACKSARVPVGMKTDGNGWKNLISTFVSIFFFGRNGIGFRKCGFGNGIGVYRCTETN